MSRARLTVVSWLVWVSGSVAACGDAFDAGVELTPSRLRSVEPTVGERFAACARDPRVVAGRVSREACAGADGLFFEVRSRHASSRAPRREGNLMF